MSADLDGLLASSSWEAEVGNAYGAFRAYPPALHMTGSPYRDIEQIVRDLNSAPLRELDPDLLSYYAATAMTTVGSAEHYKHYFPRILELAAVPNAFQGLQAFVITNKLDLAGWKQWPPLEREAVEQVVHAIWRSRLRETEGRWDTIGYDTEDWDTLGWLQLIVVTDANVPRALAEWDACDAMAADLHLASLILDAAEDNEDDRRLMLRAIEGWLYARPTADRLLRATTRRLISDVEREHLLRAHRLITRQLADRAAEGARSIDARSRSD